MIRTSDLLLRRQTAITCYLRVKWRKWTLSGQNRRSDSGEQGVNLAEPLQNLLIPACKCVFAMQSGYVPGLMLSHKAKLDFALSADPESAHWKKVTGVTTASSIPSRTNLRPGYHRCNGSSFRSNWSQFFLSAITAIHHRTLPIHYVPVF